MDGLAAPLGAALAGFVDDGSVPGLAWAVAVGDEVRAGAAGLVDPDRGVAAARGSLFRIASVTKPVVAVAALALVDAGLLALDAPVERWLPELADRRVLLDPAGPFDGPTEPARRPITVEDVLTFRMGLGMDFGAPSWPPPVITAMADLGLAGGPPDPQGNPPPHEWIARLGTLPLQHHPGERWLYNTAGDVLGVLVARAAGEPLDEVLRARVLAPLGMDDTRWWVEGADLDRFGPAFAGDGRLDERDGAWARPTAFPSGSGGLVSTVDDLLALARALLAGGAGVLRPETVQAMAADHLTPEQRRLAAIDEAGVRGWGLGGAVHVADDGARHAGAFGWDGGFGATWGLDPVAGACGVLLTNQAFTSHVPPPIVDAFWRGLRALADA